MCEECCTAIWWSWLPFCKGPDWTCGPMCDSCASCCESKDTRFDDIWEQEPQAPPVGQGGEAGIAPGGGGAQGTYGTSRMEVPGQAGP